MSSLVEQIEKIQASEMKLVDVGNLLNTRLSDALNHELQSRMSVESLIRDRMEAYYDNMNSYHNMIPQEELIEKAVISIVKGGMEKRFGIDVGTFLETYERLLKEKPEKLI